MRQFPLPELAAVLLIALVVLGLRTLWGWIPSARGAQGHRQPRRGTIDTQRKRAQLIASCVLLVLISIPLILEMVPPNGIYGFRTPFTRSSEAVWHSANAFMGWALSVAAVVSATLLMRLPPTAGRWALWGAFLAPVFGAIVASFAYLNRLS